METKNIQTKVKINGGFFMVIDYSRYPIPKTNLSQSDEITEISLGYTQDCIMLRSKNSKKNIVLFRSGRKHIHIHRDTQNGLKLLVE